MHDDELMRLTARGEEPAFRLLVERWEDGVHAFLFHMTGDAEEARDLCQDTFVKVYSQANRYHAEGRFKSWLFRIAGNLARSRLRRRKIIGWVRFAIERHDRPGSGHAPDAALERDETAQMVRRAIGKLPERQRRALVLRRYLDWSYEDIAETLDTTPSAVDALLQRTLATLREKLRGKVDEP